jgi:hypothetical protein
MRPVTRRRDLARLDLHGKALGELELEAIQTEQKGKIVIRHDYMTSYQDWM